ncbi:RNA polymerase sigma factor [Pedobacter fastidiosus]|uniref:RNA polymerase sigma-70 factor n=1 Tax=Pedobacter fastidiosus TaxID=2765361 RepID=A0ABR7KXE8_9SPHI|nr:RNA polymerase sigma-70 factor [Pedobacter fastidiosus]MBC6112800.1 RNA polymerase sigma-70 factor [Pedobacter fastidiosus]
MLDYSKYSDEELTAFLKRRDHAAFTEIYDRYWQPMFIYALKRLRDEDQAADIIQDLFTQVWNRADQLYIDTALKSYLFTSVRNQTLNILAKDKRVEAYTEKLAFAFVEGLNTTDQEVSFREFSALLEQEVRNLPPRMQAVYIKNKEQGLSHKNIAEELGITEDSSKTTLNRALNELRIKLKPFLSILLIFFG